MAAPGIMARLRSWLTGPVGPVNWTQNGGIPVGWSWNFWQQNLHPYQGGESATVNACVNAYAQTVAQLPGGHFRTTADGGQERITGSPLAKILRNPNPYQTRSDFMLNLVSELLFRGNSYAWAERDAAGTIEALHLIPAAGTQVLVEAQSRTVFYGLSENPLAGQLSYAIPARDVLHVRCRTKPGEPLNGITPLRWAAMAQAANTAISASQAAFFQQASQPSGFLSSDQTLSSDQMATLREAWMNRAAGVAAGQVPVLGGGLKFQQMTMTSQDAQLVEAFAMTVADIARAYGVPLPIIGDLSNATFNNTEQLIAFWLSTGLGFLVEHIEIAFDKFFGLPDGQFCELDTDTLLRTAFKDRIDGLTKAISGGLYSPNEARRKEGLPDAEDGDEPRLQAQVVPLSQVNAVPATTAPVPAVPQPGEDDDEVEDDPLERRLDAQAARLDQINDTVINMLTGARLVGSSDIAALGERITALEELPPPPPPVTPAEVRSCIEEQGRMLAGALEAVTNSMAEQFEEVRAEQRTVRTMLEAAEPAMDPEEADQLALVQLRRAKREAGNAP